VDVDADVGSNDAAAALLGDKENAAPAPAVTYRSNPNAFCSSGTGSSGIRGTRGSAATAAAAAAAAAATSAATAEPAAAAATAAATSTG